MVMAMTEPPDAVTVAELQEFLDQFDDEDPVAVAASGAYDFLNQQGLKEAELDPTHGGGNVAYLDGDKQ